MLDVRFTYSDLQTWLLIMVRVTSFIFVAPFFSMNNVPRRVRVGFGLALTILLYGVVDHPAITFETETEYAIIVMKEAICGILIGLGAQLCTTVTSLAGFIVDMETGMSMAQVFDVNTRMQTSITGGIYQAAFTLLMIVTGLYRYMVTALAESFTLIPLGHVNLNADKLLTAFIEFLSQYMSIAFRIALPIFCCMLLLNTVLGILAKVAPQMNMFAVGIQLKVLSGLTLLYVTAFTLPKVADFIVTEMKTVVVDMIEGMM